MIKLVKQDGSGICRVIGENGNLIGSGGIQGRLVGFSEEILATQEDAGWVRIYDQNVNQISLFGVQGKVVTVNKDSIIAEENGWYREYNKSGTYIRTIS